MIKLHYSLVDILDECIHRLEENDGKSRRSTVAPRTKILIPECKIRANTVKTESRKVSAEPLIPSPVSHATETPHDENGSIAREIGGCEDEDEDGFERFWVKNGR
jgi:hypothetical protein